MLEHLLTCTVFVSVPLEDVREEDLIKCIQSSCSKRHHCSEKDADLIGTVLFVAEASDGDHESALGKGSSGDCRQNWIDPLAEHVREDHRYLASCANDYAEDDHERWPHFGSEESQCGANRHCTDDLIDAVGLANQVFTSIVSHAESLGVLVKDARSSDQEH